MGSRNPSASPTARRLEAGAVSATTTITTVHIATATAPTEPEAQAAAAAAAAAATLRATPKSVVTTPAMANKPTHARAPGAF